MAPRTSIHGTSSSPQTTIDSLGAARPSWSVLKYKNGTSLVLHSLIKKAGPVTRCGSTRTETNCSYLQVSMLRSQNPSYTGATVVQAIATEPYKYSARKGVYSVYMLYLVISLDVVALVNTHSIDPQNTRATGTIEEC
jgi:hypothetical protein